MLFNSLTHSSIEWVHSIHSIADSFVWLYVAPRLRRRSRSRCHRRYKIQRYVLHWISIVRSYTAQPASCTVLHSDSIAGVSFQWYRSHRNSGSGFPVQVIQNRLVSVERYGSGSSHHTAAKPGAQSVFVQFGFRLGSAGVWEESWSPSKAIQSSQLLARHQLERLAFAVALLRLLCWYSWFSGFKNYFFVFLLTQCLSLAGKL